MFITVRKKENVGSQSHDFSRDRSIISTSTGPCALWNSSNRVPKSHNYLFQLQKIMKFHDFLLVFGEFSRGVENFALFFVFDFNFVFASESYHFEDKKSDQRVNFRVISKQNKENHKSENIILPLISVMKNTSGDKKIIFKMFPSNLMICLW